LEGATNFRMITYKQIQELNSADLKELFLSVDWESGKDSVMLSIAMAKATRVITAWDGKKLVGLIRSMDDGIWSANIDCLVVHKDYQHRGVGAMLLKKMVKALKAIKYINVCPDSKDNISFYQQFGFKLINGAYLQLQKN
jgi:ribosomal protein S18 acetylase RimI-like enzyme